MDNCEFDIYDYLVSATKKGENDYSIVVTNTNNNTIVDEFTLTSYKGEEDMNWEALSEAKPSRDPIIRELVAVLDSE